MSEDINKLKGFIDDIQEYTDQTTIHGIKYLGAKRVSIAEKCFWLLILGISVLVLGFFLQEVIQKWQDRNVFLVEDLVPTNIYEIPFPAVTVCPQFKIKSEYFSYENTSYLVRSNQRNKLLNDTDALRQYCDNLQSLNSFATALPSSVSLEKELRGTPNISCDCLPECNLIDYDYSIDMYSMPNRNLKKVLAQNAITQFQVYFEENLITGKTRKQLYTFVDMVSSFGGLVGLFIGASILSIFEILYFCVIRQINKLIIL